MDAGFGLYGRLDSKSYAVRVSYFVDQALEPAQAGRGPPEEVRPQNLAYVFGVLVSFLAIALVLSGLRTAGHLVGWGFQLQSPVFLSLLVLAIFCAGAEFARGL